jgi:hypothetical protein
MQKGSGQVDQCNTRDESKELLSLWELPYMGWVWTSFFTTKNGLEASFLGFIRFMIS